MPSEEDRDFASRSHQRPPFADPLAGGIDPTAPGAPHEPGGEAMRQSRVKNPNTPSTSFPLDREKGRKSRPEPPDAA